MITPENLDITPENLDIFFLYHAAMSALLTNNSDILGNIDRCSGESHRRECLGNISDHFRNHFDIKYRLVYKVIRKLKTNIESFHDTFDNLKDDYCEGRFLEDEEYIERIVTNFLKIYEELPDLIFSLIKWILGSFLIPVLFFMLGSTYTLSEGNIIFAATIIMFILVLYFLIAFSYSWYIARKEYLRIRRIPYVRRILRSSELR